MAFIQSQESKLSNFLIREQWCDMNFCRENVEVTIGLAAGTGNVPLIKMGEVVYRDATAAATEPFIRCTTGEAPPANIIVGIVVDDRIHSKDFFNFQASAGFGSIDAARLGQIQPDWGGRSTETVSLAVLVRGDALVREGGLFYGSFAEESASKASIFNQMRNQGILLEHQLSGEFLRPMAYK